MTFWYEVLASFLANMIAGVLLVMFYVGFQWFLQATDIDIGYNWRFDGTPDDPRNLRPSFDLRNRSRSRTYQLGNVAYFKGTHPVGFDNESVWGKEIKPGSIHHLDVSPVQGLSLLTDAFETEVQVRLQNGRAFWLTGQGPGQRRKGRFQQTAFWLRAKCEAWAFPLE